MKSGVSDIFIRCFQTCALLLLLFSLTVQVYARDTDIYSVNAKQNAYVLMDSSGSMAFGVYEHTIDYARMYDYLINLNSENSPPTDYIWDTVANTYIKDHKDPKRIYLLKGDIGVSIARIGDSDVALAGDAADPNYVWNPSDLIDTHTLIDKDGNLSDDGSGLARITVDQDGYVLFDGDRLPLGLDIKAHDYTTMYNHAVIDNGFCGLMNAPGFYFSGYEGVAADKADSASLDEVEDGDLSVYFFITGNWFNMQAVYNLHYMFPIPTPKDPNKDNSAWIYEPFPIPLDYWPKQQWNLKYPEGSVTYDLNLKEADTAEAIVRAGATKIRVHFSDFDIEGDGDADTFTNDYIALYDADGNEIAKYDNDNKPTSTTGWSPVAPGDTITIKLSSNSTGSGNGYAIDIVSSVENDGETYTMQSRLDVAKNAMIYVVDEFRGKMNWGFASFAGPNSGGASLQVPLNPNDTDDAQRAAIVRQIATVYASGGTPLMEALQDVWYWGFYKREVLQNLLCRKNYVISMTDGFPSEDDDNNRIPEVIFADWDNDHWTQDPMQDLDGSEDFYDDVAHWMYTHSWIDQSPISDPANSYENVITHHIAFGAKHPLLEDAAGESGGEYIVAYNKDQLVSAFYSLALMMSEAVSFTAPVVSVDAVNKIQSGEDLYMGLFLPQDSNYWVGNVKKFKIGDGSSATRKLFMIYDKDGNEAINSLGNFLDNTAGFWGDDLDENDRDQYGSADIKEDGAGEVLLEDVQSHFNSKNYYSRNIYTWKDGDGDSVKEMVKFDRTNISPDDLGVIDDTTRNKLINFIYGYTYDALTTGDPMAVRDWVLGSIIHSQPVVVDYYDTTQSTLPLLKRYIVVGSNDGMLHVFDDDTGKEVLAFIPPDLLGDLKYVQANDLYDTVDGTVSLYRRNKNPKYLIFGERRGGGYYWNLDVHDINPLNWTVAWSYTNNEIVQSWSEVKFASIPVNITSAGERIYKDVAIFTGGYDPEEDYYPEPFNDVNSDGTPYMANGQIDNNEWVKNNSDQDVNGDFAYNAYNPGQNEHGRGIFIVDIDNPEAVTTVPLNNSFSSGRQMLPFSATFGTSTQNTGRIQTYPEMNYSFPSSPSIATGTDINYYSTPSGTAKNVQTNVLLAMYAPDIYANLYKVVYDMYINNFGTDAAPDWRATWVDWTTSRVFSGNPGSTSTRAGDTANNDFTDQGRKAFYPPAISWGGSKGYFEAGNFYFPDITFYTKNRMASLFFGTGDRENPKYTMIRNRFYGIYDDSSVLSYDTKNKTFLGFSSSPYHEKDLLNLTCDELGRDSIISSCYLGDLNGSCDFNTADADMKSYLKSLLRDDAVYKAADGSKLEMSINEDDKKGWFIVLNDQGDSGICAHMNYSTLIEDTAIDDHDNHYGEQILSEPSLYYGTLYFTSFQASGSDSCNPRDNGFSYALNYLDASATYDLNYQSSHHKDITDRYKKFTDITGIPSGYTIITHKGKAGAMASMGGAVIGPGSPQSNDYQINSQGTGLELYYWQDMNSQAD